MVHVSATSRCTLNGISTCVFLLLGSRSNVREFSDYKLLLLYLIISKCLSEIHLLAISTMFKLRNKGDNL